jgi:hypothetical protein
MALIFLKITGGLRDELAVCVFPYFYKKKYKGA